MSLILAAVLVAAAGLAVVIFWPEKE